ncbi:MAG: ThuA domain-containing protein [Puniceicoccaceae bacterium]|nr:MAG: ThuA domain-containing protein [Puniceicoccaceae bacterium]
MRPPGCCCGRPARDPAATARSWGFDWSCGDKPCPAREFPDAGTMHRIGDEQRNVIDQAVEAALKLPGMAGGGKGARRRLLVTNLNVRDGRILDGHPSIDPSNYAIARLGELSGRFTAFFSNDPACFEPAALEDFDAICFNNTFGVLTEDKARQQGLLDFVRGGKGFVGIHAAAATFCQYPRYDQFPEFGRMLGGYENGGHPWGPKETITLTPEDAESPLNAPFGGKDFEIQDEVFQMKDHYSRDRLRVLLRINLEKSDFGPERRILAERRADRDIAISWIREEGKGRVFYTSLGHNPHLFWNPPVLGHFHAGIRYALGDLAADATPRPLPA